ncbi:MAG: hypothetical protein R2788_06305 [Saprospiraceae bacterium]
MGSRDLDAATAQCDAAGRHLPECPHCCQSRGEIRGQVYKLAREAYSYQFSGGQEVPAVTTATVAQAW